MAFDSLERKKNEESIIEKDNLHLEFQQTLIETVKIP
jgi:hypothetical protein